MKTLLQVILIASSLSVTTTTTTTIRQEPCGSWGGWQYDVDGCAYRCRQCFNFGTIPPTVTNDCEHQWPCDGADKQSGDNKQP